jgi:hypothetical protein
VPSLLSPVGVAHTSALGFDGGPRGGGVNTKPVADSCARPTVLVKADRVSKALSVEALTAYGDALTVQVRGYGHAVDAEPGSEFVDSCPGQVPVDEHRDLTF